MKKEFMICIIVIAFVIIGNILTQNHTKQCMEEMNKQLSELKEKIIIQEKSETEEQTLKTKSKEIKQNWDNMQETLSFYIEHDELEKVETRACIIDRRNGNQAI